MKAIRAWALIDCEGRVLGWQPYGHYHHVLVARDKEALVADEQSGQRVVRVEVRVVKPKARKPRRKP